jgi:hypothetical protein
MNFKERVKEILREEEEESGRRGTKEWGAGPEKTLPVFKNPTPLEVSELVKRSGFSGHSQTQVKFITYNGNIWVFLPDVMHQSVAGKIGCLNDYEENPVLTDKCMFGYGMLKEITKTGYKIKPLDPIIIAELKKSIPEKFKQIFTLT